MGILGGAQDAERIHGIPIGGLVLGHDLVGRPPLLGGPIDDVVIDVGDVGDVVDLDAGPLQIAAQDVVDERLPPVAEVGNVVHRRAADVHRELAALPRDDVDDPSLRRVVQPQHFSTVIPEHGPTSS